MKLKLRSILLIIIICSQAKSFGQLMLDDIQLTQIRHKTIRKYVEFQIDQGKHHFYDIRPSWNKGEDLSAFRKKEMTFIIEGNMQEIWNGYITANPSKSWNGRKISFELLLQKFPNNIFYNQEPIMGIDTGQVYFLNLKIAHGLCNIPVAFEIINIDTDKKIIEFSYIEGNKSMGVQRIKFKELGDNKIKIKHVSYFKSDSNSRDKILYPFFHKKIVNDFHRNMRKILASNRRVEL